MSRAHEEGSRVRRRLGLSGRVDAESVAARLGLTVVRWSLSVPETMRLVDHVAVAERLDPPWRRWAVGRAIGHCVLHPGDDLYIHRQTGRVPAFEREADDFAFGLLVDTTEAVAEGFVHSWEIARHFGIPDEVVRLQNGSAGE
ncbi:MAG: ImmA/IrrE family metallo-endopeptidase [Dehalococcoidia bacterium]|nr:ImmA/IrrE family metallo-endopeptidase [Dehalococcoidia bacterium]